MDTNGALIPETDDVVMVGGDFKGPVRNQLTRPARRCTNTVAVHPTLRRGYSAALL